MGNHQKEIFLVLSIFLTGFQCVWAQTTQKGIVVEMSSNNKPVAGAEIKVAGASVVSLATEAEITDLINEPPIMIINKTGTINQRKTLSVNPLKWVLAP